MSMNKLIDKIYEDQVKNKQIFFRCPADWIDGEELGCFLFADEGMISF